MADRHDLAAADRAWQRRLRPFMEMALGGLMLFFCAASVLQYRDLVQRVDRSPGYELPPMLTTALNADPHWASLVALETSALDRRYRQANILLLSRVWTRQIGFATGMILALVGAAFILGKLNTDTSELTAEGPGWKGGLKSSSPGLILAGLGTILMVTSIVTQYPIGVVDRAVYTGGAQPAPTLDAPPDFGITEAPVAEPATPAVTPSSETKPANP